MTLQDKLDAVPDVIIDTGIFKYIQIRITCNGAEKIIIRGSKDADYHADVFDSYAPQLKTLGLSAECIGGGRIKHDLANKALDVYGYSMGYGRADHKITVAKLKNHYAGYNITWSNDGY